MASKSEAKVFEVIEPFVSHCPDDGIDYAFRRGDRVSADHWVCRQASLYLLPVGFTITDEESHRRKHRLLGRR
jgi:hypothetical protein